MPIVEALQSYFRAERDLGLALAVVGLLFLAGAVWVHRTQSGGFAWGLLVPAAVVGLAFSLGGVFLAQRSHGQITSLAEQAERAPATFLADEVPRMERVNANWPRVKMVWTVGLLVALLLLQVVRREWATGLGLALLATLGVLFFVDVFAERRAEAYTEALRDAARLG